jgi:5-methylcytosine-specific restriction endonuclease McrA
MIEYNKFYKTAKWTKARDRVKARDNYSCVHCYTRKGMLSVHHKIPIPWDSEGIANLDIYKDYDRLFNEKNLETVCNKCHRQLDISELKQKDSIASETTDPLEVISFLKGSDDT